MRTSSGSALLTGTAGARIPTARTAPCQFSLAASDKAGQVTVVTGRKPFTLLPFEEPAGWPDS